MTTNVILLVEDNPDDEALTQRALRKHNILNPIVVAHDGVEALDYIFRTGEYAERSPESPIVVLLDLKLPRLNGMDVLRRIRADEHTRLLPVVVLTSSSEDEDILQGYSLGANSYVRKPVDFGQFMHAVGLVGMYWLMVNEPAPVVKAG